MGSICSIATEIVFLGSEFENDKTFFSALSFVYLHRDKETVAITQTYGHEILTVERNSWLKIHNYGYETCFFRGDNISLYHKLPFVAVILSATKCRQQFTGVN